MPQAITPDCILMIPSAESSRLFQSLRGRREIKNAPSILLLTEGNLDQFETPLLFDDFLLQPLRVPELIARIKQAFQRRRRFEGREVLSFGHLIIDLEKYEVTLTGKIVDLTYKEYELLRLLATNNGKVFTRENLLNRVWGYDYYGGTRTVDVHIRRLRSKIEDSTHSFIETVRGVGYKFKAR